MVDFIDPRNSCSVNLKRLLDVEADDVDARFGEISVEVVRLEEVLEDHVGMAAIREFGDDRRDLRSPALRSGVGWPDDGHHDRDEKLVHCSLLGLTVKWLYRLVQREIRAIPGGMTGEVRRVVNRDPISKRCLVVAQRERLGNLRVRALWRP